MHPSTFHSGFVETVLFKEWHISNWQGMLGTVVAITLLAVLYESLKYLREYLHYKKANESASSTAPKSIMASIFSKHHIAQTILIAFQVLLSNVLMLVSMTYNIYLYTALIFGATLAYFLLFWKPHTKRAVIKIDNKRPEPSEISTNL